MGPLRITKDGGDGLGGVADKQGLIVSFNPQPIAFQRVLCLPGLHVTIRAVMRCDLDQLAKGASKGLFVGLNAHLILKDALKASLFIGHFSGLAVGLPVVLVNQRPRFIVCRHLTGHERPCASKQGAVLISKALRVKSLGCNPGKHPHTGSDGGDQVDGASNEAPRNVGADVLV